MTAITEQTADQAERRATPWQCLIDFPALEGSLSLGMWR